MRHTRICERLIVRPRPGAGGRRGVLLAGALRLPVALGESGLSHLPREGGRATPVADMALLAALYRPDRVRRPQTALPVKPIRPDDGWCDAPFHPRYNRPVALPFAASHERLWRDDRLYDLVVVPDFNIHPREQGRGSAIFLHVAEADFSPTAGCIALKKGDLERLLARCGPGTRLLVAP